MVVRVPLILAIITCLFFPVVSATAITVTVSSQANVKGPVMTLGEVADIKGEDSERVKQLRTLPLGSAPVPGTRMTLTAELLGARLSNSGADFSGITWEVPPLITVATTFRTISGKLLYETAVNAVYQQTGISRDNSDLQISPIYVPGDVTTSDSDSMLMAEFPYGIRYNAPTTAVVSIYSDGRLLAKETLRLDVKQYRQVLVARRLLSAGELLTADCLQFARMETGQSPQGYYTDTKSVIGLAAARSILPGTVVHSGLVVKPIVIRRGSIVSIQAKVGSVEVVVSGQALQDGYVGQIIRVQNTNSHKIISAKVLNESTVLTLAYGR